LSQPISTDDWDRHWGDYAESAAANPAQRYRLRLILSHLAFSGARAHLVDIGSGQGDLLVEVRRRWPQTELLGIELSEAGCRIARLKVPQATLLQRDLLKPGDVPPAFRRWGSHAVCSEVLEHVDRPDRLLLNATAFLAPGCRLVVTVPGGPMSAFDRHIGHRRHYTQETLSAVLEAAGLEVERVAAAGFPFHSLYRLAVLARGRNLAADVAGPSSWFRRGVMRAFDATFRLNLPTSPWGWQLVAIARVPG
jgi:2-polyprenyl-3-methyl-5-hydroxy-6-metoxy-1,4-benzoquinol methylase